MKYDQAIQYFDGMKHTHELQEEWENPSAVQALGLAEDCSFEEFVCALAGQCARVEYYVA